MYSKIFIPSIMSSRIHTFVVIPVIATIVFSVYYAGIPADSERKPDKEITIGFYNVENLFDTIDDPHKDDNEFLPTAERQWNSARYTEKIVNLGSVISKIGGDYPEIMGLSEIENDRVLKDLISTPSMAEGNYAFIHYESPDERGIDVALLYRSEKFTPVYSRVVPVTLPDGARPTRDILYVKGQVVKGPELHIFVNHWPSRWGGMEASEPKRLAAAAALRQITDSVMAADPDANIICMGDLNDYPHNRSLIEVMDAGYIDSATTYINLMSGLRLTKRGSYNYKGSWDFLDQILISRPLADGKKPDIDVEATGPYLRREMVYENENYGDVKTNRSYGGTKYFGGYSDHLPVFTKLKY